MSSRNVPRNDRLDNFIGRSLKNWLEQQHPPANAKKRLLHAVSVASNRKNDLPQFRQPILRYLAYRFTAALTLNTEEQVKYPTLTQKYLFDTNFHSRMAYHTIIYSIPSGRGLLCF